MKRHPYNPYSLHLLALAILLTLSGCIHTYPHGEGIDPSVTKLRLSLILDEEWDNISQPFESKASQDENESSRAVGMPDRRFLIQLVRDGVVAEEKTFSIPYDEVTDNRIDLPNIFTLDSRSCTIAVWSDFINPDTGEALAYDISSPSQIVTTAPHGRDIYTQDCLSGHAVYSLGSDGHRNEQTTTIEMHLSPPQGRLKLVATDYEAFMQQTLSDRKKGESYTVNVKYESEIPTAYNLSQNSLMAPSLNMDFSVPFITLYGPGDEYQIAADRLFATDRQYTTALSVVILNSAKMVVSRTPTIEVPVQGGKVTTISGNLLTWFISGGFNIDTEWAGEITIEI